MGEQAPIEIGVSNKAGPAIEIKRLMSRVARALGETSVIPISRPALVSPTSCRPRTRFCRLCVVSSSIAENACHYKTLREPSQYFGRLFPTDNFRER